MLAFYPYKDALIVHNNPELFTEQIAEFVMVFILVKLNDGKALAKND